nr:hypothetical protein CFP56_13044 [Quercus suber]
MFLHELPLRVRRTVPRRPRPAHEQTQGYKVSKRVGDTPPRTKLVMGKGPAMSTIRSTHHPCRPSCVVHPEHPFWGSSPDQVWWNDGPSTFLL